MHMRYRITGITRERKVMRITFFAIVREKTFTIQAISYTKITAEVKSARNIHECFQIRKICKLILPRTIIVICTLRVNCMCGNL